MKINATGGTSWHQHYGGSFSDNGTSVRQTTDGGYIISGNSGPYAAGDLYMLKTDPGGTQKWTRTFGGKNLDWSEEVQQTTDGGYVIAGCTSSNSAGLIDGYLIKADATGSPLWTTTFGGSRNDYFHSVQQTTDGGYI